MKENESGKQLINIDLKSEAAFNCKASILPNQPNSSL